MRNLIFVDCEAAGPSVVSGVLAEFGAVHYGTRRTFHGRLFECTPDPANPAVPVVGARVAEDADVARAFADWLQDVAGGERVAFVSDNPAFDWQWIAALFDRGGIGNPFGHSARRIGDFWAGTRRDFFARQSWKDWRRTAHDHNPVHDALGNAEAFERILQELRGPESS
ncbi:3'-5' exoribonuclease domain-containing protein [Pseudonocardia sp. CA-107938]|uniref:3'-5' exoribonuclease domain-containing protein n=1 Tax=Pseudonocardia sp. CA-107938 TaxID=3240021 RepID=UPI003D901D7F